MSLGAYLAVCMVEFLEHSELFYVEDEDDDWLIDGAMIDWLIAQSCIKKNLIVKISTQILPHFSSSEIGTLLKNYRLFVTILMEIFIFYYICFYSFYPIEVLFSLWL